MTIKTELSRRSFIKSAAVGASAVAVPMALTGCGGDDDKDESISAADSKLVVAFGHGVASGDPLSDRVIIWSRVTHTEATAQTVPVDWAVATDEAMTTIVASGSVQTNEAIDYTLKVDVDGLSANTTYYYQFTGPLAAVSVTGQTKTLPVGYVEKVKFAVCSCANYPAGFFNVYQAMSKSDADVVLHLGDYIYEYGEGEYGDARVPAPATEITSLADYRTRYSQYRIDEQAQSVHKVKPFICVWDDHEVANDTYKDGAANHNDGEGDFETRKAAAFQAYHEWMPIRTGTDKEIIYRNFKFGELISLNMMDTRHIARDKPLGFTELLTAAASSSEEAAALIADPSRRLIGDEQLSWLIQEWTNSTTTWEVLGQQVLMGRIMAPSEMLLPIAGLQAKLEADSDADVSTEQAAVNKAISELYTLKLIKNAGGTLSVEDETRLASVAPYNLDAWDGYFVEREQILNRAHLLGKNVISLAGDTHNAWASDLRFVADTTTGALSEKSVGVEFATSSVSSPGFDQYLSLSATEKVVFESAITELVEDLCFMDATRRGFMEVTFTPDHATSEWIFSDIATKPAAGDDVVTDNNYVQLIAQGNPTVLGTAAAINTAAHAEHDADPTDAGHLAANPTGVPITESEFILTVTDVTPKKSKFRVYPYSSGRSDANTLIPVTD
ncbi:MAG: alkaline phosphatase D family protein [Oleispira sp.]|nr:alkaline phosphatase D family protein [Oleispira sp.]